MAGSTFFDKLLSRRTSRILLIALVLLVLALSLIPKPETVLGAFSVYDKLGHFAAYIVLGFFALRATGRTGPLAILMVVACCAAFGGIIEIIQPLVGRNRELADFLVDLGGAIVGAVTAALLSHRARARESTSDTGYRSPTTRQ
jgi:VanZ family protein